MSSYVRSAVDDAENVRCALTEFVPTNRYYGPEGVSAAFERIMRLLRDSADSLDLYEKALTRIGELNPQLGDGETDRPNEVDEA